MAEEKKKISLYYLSLGSIALYISVGTIGNYGWFLQHAYITDFEASIEYFITISTALISGVLLIITCYGLLYRKRYHRHIGISGCALFVIHNAYRWISISEFRGVSIWQMSVYLPMIASIILLILTLTFWKKLA